MGRALSVDLRERVENTASNQAETRALFATDFPDPGAEMPSPEIDFGGNLSQYSGA